MATTINLSLQSQNSGQHVMTESHSLMTFSKLPWKASQLKHPSDTYHYSSRQLHNAFFPLVGNQLRRSYSQQLEIKVDRMSVISSPAQLQPRPPTRKCDLKPSLHHKNVKYHEPFLYPDPLGDTRPELSKFYQRIAKISQLEDDSIKYEDSRRKTHSKPTTFTTTTTTHFSRSASARTLNKAPSVKSVARRCGTISLNDQSEDHLQSPTHDIVSHTPYVSPIASPTHSDVTLTDDVITSPTHNSTADHEVCKPGIDLPASDIISPTHSDKDSNSETMVCGPVLLHNGQLTTKDYEQARRHLSKSHDQLASCHKTTRVTSHAKTRKKSLKNRPSSATLLLTESNSSTSVSSICSDKSHVKQSKFSSNKKRHKK